jgi:hypothetical protein
MRKRADFLGVSLYKKFDEPLMQQERK